MVIPVHLAMVRVKFTSQNFKPENADQWKQLAKDYTKKTGVEVKVQNAASGTYEQTLKSEIARAKLQLCSR